jgi:hypothetical protein
MFVSTFHFRVANQVLRFSLCLITKYSKKCFHQKTTQKKVTKIIINQKHSLLGTLHRPLSIRSDYMFK